MLDKNAEEGISEVRKTLRQMILRNLRIALVLRPKLLQLKEKLGYSPLMSPEEYLVWKKSKAGDVTEGIEKLLKDYNIPVEDTHTISEYMLGRAEEMYSMSQYNPRKATLENLKEFFNKAFEGRESIGL